MKIFNYPVFSSPNMIKTVFTRPQRRKIKNRRWCKKWRKKYSRQVPEDHCIVNNVNNRIFCHPTVFEILQKEQEKNTRRTDMNNVYTNIYGGLLCQKF